MMNSTIEEQAAAYYQTAKEKASVIIDGVKKSLHDTQYLNTLGVQADDNADRIYDEITELYGQFIDLANDIEYNGYSLEFMTARIDELLNEVVDIQNNLVKYLKEGL